VIFFDSRFRPWLERKLGTTLPEDAIFVGSILGGVVVAAVAFSHYSGHDIHVSMAIEKGKGTRQLMRQVFGYVFGRCACSRMTALIRPDNLQSRQLAERFGFKHEGLLRNFYGEQDAMIFGLLKSELPHVVTRQASQGS
jgi:RimJ/RimL family protein N-acetyltransferase